MFPSKRHLLGFGAVLASGLGAALASSFPAVGLGIATLGVMIGIISVGEMNTPISRALSAVAGLAFAAACWLATGSIVLGVGAAATVLALLASMTFVIQLPASSFVIFGAVSAVIGGATIFAAWPVGWSALALAPPSLFALLLAAGGLKSLSEVQGRQLASKIKLRIGESMPAFELPVRGGGTFKLEEERGRPVVLCFLRGDWCPVCHVFMRQFRKESKRLAEKNVKLVAISPSGGEDAELFAKDFAVDYVMLIDDKAQSAKAWGLLQQDRKHGEDVPLPVSLLVDKEGILRFVTNPHEMSPITDHDRLFTLLEGQPA